MAKGRKNKRKEGKCRRGEQPECFFPIMYIFILVLGFIFIAVSHCLNFYFNLNLCTKFMN